MAARVDMNGGGAPYGTFPAQASHSHSSPSSHSHAHSHGSPWAEQYFGSNENLSSFVLEVTEGLVTSYGVMLGIVALSNMARDWVLLIGLTAVMTQGAAKAGSEWTAAVLQDEQEDKEVKTESEHIHTYPEEEELHMAALLRDFGLQPRTIELINHDAKARPDFMLRLHSKFELGLDLDAPRTSPTRIAAYTFASFLLGAFMPLLPWVDPFFVTSLRALVLSSLLVVAVLGVVSMFNASFMQTRLNRMKVLSLHTVYLFGFLVVFLAASFVLSEVVAHLKAPPVGPAEVLVAQQ